jgi:hypothetical protein
MARDTVRQLAPDPMAYFTKLLQEGTKGMFEKMLILGDPPMRVVDEGPALRVLDAGDMRYLGEPEPADGEQK